MPIISINKRQTKRISDKSVTKIHSNCKDIIPFGQLYPTIGIRLTRLSRNMTVIPLVSVGWSFIRGWWSRYFTYFR